MENGVGRISAHHYRYRDAFDGWPSFDEAVERSSGAAEAPVIIFSSLITEDLRHQGEKAGADAQVSKPEIMELVTKIDQYIL